MGRPAAVNPAECTLATLGSFELRIRGKSVPNPATQKARALLSYLVLHRRTDVPRERLIEVFWPDAEPERARDSLNTALHSIRRGLRAAQFDPNDFLFANKSIVRWEAGVDLDVERLERALQSKDETAASEALTHYHGDFLEGDYDDWTVTQRELVSERYEHLLSRTMHSTKAPDVAKRLLARNPYDEDAYATLIEAELSAGRYFSASQIVSQCHAALDEVGTKPSDQFLSRFKNIDRDLARGPATLDVPFVGRDAELDELVQIIERERSGLPHVALIEGEPGIGKTALLERLTKHAAARGIRVVSVRAVCDDSRAFGIWPALYSSLTGCEFSTFLAQTKGSAASELATAIAENLGEPSLLAVDDAQYLSGDGLDTLVALSKRLAAAQTHVILIAVRPEGLNRILQSLGETPYAAIRLTALTDSDVDTAIALAGVEMDAATTGSLRSRARGHPLYLKGRLEQLVRSGALRRDGRRWELAQPEAELHLPPSLRRLVEGRFRARGSDAILVACALALEPAAVPSEIAQVTELPEVAVLDALDDLLGHHIVVEPQAGPRQFAFAHDLLEETARNLLPATRRAGLHAAFALAMSASDASGRAVRRAAHYEAAGKFSLAAAAYLEAAQESSESQAPHATLQRCDAGLRCAAQLEDSPGLNVIVSHLYQARSFAHRLLWELDACFSAAQQAVDRARATDDLRCLADALAVLRSAINVTTMDQEHALRVARELASTGERLGDDGLVVQSLIDEGHTYRICFDLDAAEPSLRRAFEVATRSERPELVMKAAIQLLSLQAGWWRFENALDIVQAVRKNEMHVDWRFRTHASLAMVMLLTEIERYDQAQAELRSVARFLDTAIVKGPKSGPHAPRPEIAIRVDYFQAVLDARRCDWNGGLSRFHTYRPMYESLMNEQRYRALFAAARADLLLGRGAAGDVDSAFDMLAEIETPWDPETGFEPYHAAMVVRARVSARRRLANALSQLEEAFDFLEAEVARCPFGIDMAFGRLAESAAELGEAGLARRAEAAHDRYRTKKLGAGNDLVSV